MKVNLNQLQFFKPNLEKIIIFIIFSLFGFSLSIIECPEVIWNYCQKSINVFDDVFHILPLFIYNTFPIINQSLIAGIFLIGITFLWYYFISCLIIWIFDKKLK